MVERYVFIKLKGDYANAAGRQEVIDRALADLQGIPGVTRLIVGGPADEHCENAWDVSIVVVFTDLADVSPYLDHPEHRRFVDDFLVPRMEVIKYWNFEVTVVDSAP